MKRNADRRYGTARNIVLGLVTLLFVGGCTATPTADAPTANAPTAKERLSPSTSARPPTNEEVPVHIEPEVLGTVLGPQVPEPPNDPADEITRYFQQRTDVFFPAIVAGIEADHPLISEFYAEPIRSRWQDSVRRWISKDERVRGTVSFRLLTLDHSGEERAEAFVCYLDQTNIITAEGQNRSPAETVPRVHRYSMVRGDSPGQWLMSEQTLAIDPETGASPWLCDLP